MDLGELTSDKQTRVLVPHPQVPGDPPPPSQVPVLVLSTLLAPSGSSGNTVFHFQGHNICADNHLYPSALLGQLAAVHSAVRAYLKKRNFKLTLGDSK